jgi:hypothetical protein
VGDWVVLEILVLLENQELLDLPEILVILEE